MADIDAVVAGIEAGDYDDNLAEIVAACRERVFGAGRELRWRMTVEGETWDEDTITIGELRLVARTTGSPDDWPGDPVSSPDLLTTYVIAHWHLIDGMDLAEAWDKAGRLNAKALVGAVQLYQGPGKGQAASTT